MPPAEVDAHPAVVEDQEAELVRRLEVALSQLPAEERTAVVSAVAYAGGSVGAAMELGIEVPDADALTRNGLQLLRAALADLDAHGVPVEEARIGQATSHESVRRSRRTTAPHP
jgi:DNA-directed RNA polymerase specialized sigma24 family protein